MPEVIDRFDGTEYAFLSNFYVDKQQLFGGLGYAPVVWLGGEYMTSEHAFQAAKTKTSADHDFVAAAESPRETKKRGRTIQIREDWDQVRDGIMYSILEAKFERPHLRERLLATAPAELIEGTTGWHDNYWGNCSCEKCVGIEGQNKLGKLLMQLRDELSKIG